MLRLIGRTVLVCLGLLAIFVAAQWQLSRSRDQYPEVRLHLEASQQVPGMGAATWDFQVCEAAVTLMEGRPASVGALMDRVASCRDPLSIQAKGHDDALLWRFDVAADGKATLDGRPSDLAALRSKVEAALAAENVLPVRQVTVADVMAANLPNPVYEHVSLPGHPYRKSGSDDPDEPEVVIEQYSGPPMFDDLSKIPEKLKPYYDDLGELPPVEQRLPENPAVLRAIESVGHYSDDGTPMLWRRATQDDLTNFNVKIGYPALVRFDWAGRLQPHLAWKWEVSDQNRVYTFWLRKGLKWSDGHPFTTEDVLFVTEDVIEMWNYRMDWMQETDGSNMLYVEDVLDWPGLAAAILRQAGSDEPSPGRQIWRVVDADPRGELASLKTLLAGITPETPPDEVSKAKIVSKLNSVFGRRTFYDAQAWKDVDFTSELEQLKTRGFSTLNKKEIERYEVLLMREDWLRRAGTIGDEEQWLAGHVTRFGVLLFRAAYRDFVVPAVRERVKVEGVPDENGNTSHILRFTFKQPNAILLEKTATFMFYLGLFQRAKHYYARWHPSGSKVLNDIDVVDWPGFWAKVMKQAAASEPSPGKRLWERMPEAMRVRLKERIPDNDRDKDTQYKKDAAEAVNEALRHRDFYDAKAWTGVDLDSELALWFDKHYGKLQGRDRRRVRHLLKRKDMLRRGVENLNEDELFELNLMMLRAAYDGDPKKEAEDRDDGKLLAIDREDALDKLAQHYGYRTWGVMYSESYKYHPVWNRHVPTLCPWRVVSEPEDATVVAVRNPYYFKVDREGKQLPYIDVIEAEKVERKEIRLLKLRSGNVDMQSRHLEFDDYTPLKQNEADGGYEIRLWANDYCGEVTFWICQQHRDPEYRELQADPRIRQALSLALNRQEIIDVVFNGLGTPAQFSVPEGSKYYNARLHHAYVEYDPERANHLLDEMGLDKRNEEGIRLLPGGRPFMLEVSFESERPLAAVQLACDQWRALGIKILMKERSGKIKWRLYRMGKYDIWTHKEGASFFGPAVAGSFAPTHAAESVQFSAWAQWLRSGGRDGEEPPERIKDLDFMWKQVIQAPTEADKLRAWTALTDRAAEELPVLGVSTSPGKVIYVRKNFKNVPKLALAGWIAHEPGNCNPEMFYIEPEKDVQDE
ncbi:MAG: hypothetical protein JXL80_11690 [Planctomycetes bacterium]|nr:hypothetical protein [Planctomycetota bacterium]